MTSARFGIVLAALLLSTGARAAPPPAAVKLFTQCIAEFEAGRHATARTCFLKVYEIYKSPVVLFNLGRTEEALGNIVDAFEAYQGCAADTSGTLSAEERADVAQRTEALVRRLGRFTLPALPAGAMVLVDGRTRNPAMAGGIAVIPGEHEVRVEAPGMQAWSERVTLAPGENRTLAVSLRPTEAQPSGAAAPTTQPPPAPAKAPAAGGWPPATPPPKAPPRGTQSSSSSMSTLGLSGIVIGGLGAASLVVGAVFGGLAIQKNNAAKPHCSTVTRDLCDPEGVNLTNTAYNYALVSTITLAAGGAALAAGVALFVVGQLSRREVRRASRIVPVVGPTWAGLALQGGF